MLEELAAPLTAFLSTTFILYIATAPSPKNTTLLFSDEEGTKSNLSSLRRTGRRRSRNRKEWLYIEVLRRSCLRQMSRFHWEFQGPKNERACTRSCAFVSPVDRVNSLGDKQHIVAPIPFILYRWSFRLVRGVIQKVSLPLYINCISCLHNSFEATHYDELV